MSPLSNAIEYLRGIAYAPRELVPRETEGAVVCFRTRNVQAPIDLDDVIAVPRRLVLKDALLVRQGDLLLSSSNTWARVGKVCAIPRLPFEATAGGFVAIIRPRPHVDARYLFHWLNHEPTQQRIRQCARQTTSIANLSVEQFKSLPFSPPPLPEQRHMGKILDRAQSLGRRCHEAASLLGALLRASFLERFGDPIANPRGWPTYNLLELCASTQYGPPQKSNDEGRGVPLLRMNNLTYEGGLDTADLKWVELGQAAEPKMSLRPGDVLFNRANSLDLVGKTAVFRLHEPFSFAAYLIRLRLRPELALPEYVSAALNAAPAKRLLRSIAKPSLNIANISTADLARITLAVPPLAEQAEYGALVERVLAMEPARRDAARAADALLASLRHRAFGG